jgi:hypothetical protein
VIEQWVPVANKAKIIAFKFSKGTQGRYQNFYAPKLFLFDSNIHQACIEQA